MTSITLKEERSVADFVTSITLKKKRSVADSCDIYNFEGGEKRSRLL